MKNSKDKKKSQVLEVVPSKKDKKNKKADRKAAKAAAKLAKRLAGKKGKEKVKADFREGSMISKMFEDINAKGTMKVKDLQKLGKANVNNRIYQMNAVGKRSGRFTIVRKGDTVSIKMKAKKAA